MDRVIKFFTAEAGLFVRNLKFFSKIENILINRQLVDLLSDAAVDINALIENAGVIETPSGQNVIDLIFGFDERQYCLRRFLECRSCGELIALSTEEFNAHMQKHQLTVANVSDNFYLPEISAEPVYKNNVATSDCGTIDRNQNFVPEDFDSNHGVTISPTYSDVISSTAPLQDESRGTSPSTIQSYDDQSECQAPDVSVDSGYGTSYLIKVRGLPWTATKKDLLDFFENVHISNGLDGIHFITDDQNNFGVAYIQLSTRKDYERAQNFHHKLLGDRYVEVLKACKQDFAALNDIQKNHSGEKVLRLEGLPWDSKENDIRLFFGGLKIVDIGLVLDEKSNHTLEAFVLFATSDDFDLALKRNWEILGNRHVKIFRSSEKQMKLRIKVPEQQKRTNVEEQSSQVKVNGQKKHVQNPDALISLPVGKMMEKKTQKDEWQRVGSRRTKSSTKKVTPPHQCYMVLARGFQWKVTKKDVIDFFKGIKIVNGEKGINIIKNVAMEAYVELASKADVKAALKLDNKRVDDRMIHISEVEPKDIGNIASRISKTNESKVAQIRGLPWAVDKAYIMKLFPNIKVQKNRIQIEVDENNRRTGYAYVEFETIEDYNAALETDFKHINQFVKLFAATKEKYQEAVAGNTNN